LSGHQDGGDLCTLSGSGILVHSEQVDWQIASEYQIGDGLYLQAGSGILAAVESLVRMEMVIFHRLAVESWQLLSGCQDGVVYIYTHRLAVGSWQMLSG